MWERRLWERKLRERRRVPWRPRQGQGLAEETWTESEAARGWRCRLPLFVRLGKAQDHPTFFFVVHWQAGNQHGIEDEEPRRGWRVGARAGRWRRTRPRGRSPALGITEAGRRRK